ncbi:MAG: aminoacyl-histidine dipeptidase [Rikenellaceae bacterium]|nr:aminoacyl-histidine dipeptidase [Rikenellaceae bacterium]
MESPKVLSYFSEICKIPRESGHEEMIVAYLENFARENSLEYKIDEAGNIVISKEATPGMESIPTVVLQSHSDMVCEKNSNSTHDFSKDPIKVVEENGWLIAKETTLGADCGIGMAAQMAILTDSTIEHGRIEALFTTDEETGLTGAKALKPGFITGNFLINLDSEDEGELFIGCAGGMDTTALFKYKRESVPSGMDFMKVGFYGAAGGHSGDDINKNRANANQLLTRFLLPIFEKYKIAICKIDGGNKRNAISREAYATIAFNPADKDKILNLFKKAEAEIVDEYMISDPDLFGKIETTQLEEWCMDPDTTYRLLNSLNACPHGVLAMSQEIPGFVETSTNLASVKMTPEEEIIICTSQRSSLNSARYQAASRIESLFKLAGAHVTHESEYPGWKPKMDSKLLSVSKDAYIKLFGNEPIVRAIHAGLECGLFLDKYPNLDMISFGPTLRGVHAPGEKLEISTVDKFWKLLIQILKDIK